MAHKKDPDEHAYCSPEQVEAMRREHQQPPPGVWTDEERKRLLGTGTPAERRARLAMLRGERLPGVSHSLLKLMFVILLCAAAIVGVAWWWGRV